MKARKILNNSDVSIFDKKAQYDYKRQVYDLVVDEITAQILSTVIYTLEVEYGFGKKRIRDFCNALHRTNADMIKGVDFFGQKRTLDLSRYDEEIKRKYDIDLRKEFKPVVSEYDREG